MYRSRTVWRLNYRMVLSAERELEPATLNPANLNPHPAGPFPSPTNATSTVYGVYGHQVPAVDFFWIRAGQHIRIVFILCAVF